LFSKLSDEDAKLEAHLDEERYRALFVEELEEDIRHGKFAKITSQLAYWYLKPEIWCACFRVKGTKV